MVQTNKIIYCTVLYCTVLYCTVLYCTVQFVIFWSTRLPFPFRICDTLRRGTIKRQRLSFTVPHSVGQIQQTCSLFKQAAFVLLSQLCSDSDVITPDTKGLHYLAVWNKSAAWSTVSFIYHLAWSNEIIKELIKSSSLLPLLLSIVDSLTMALYFYYNLKEDKRHSN